MSRPLRIQYPGAWYHVMNRGWDHDDIFLDRKDYASFLELMGKCHALFDLEVHAYSLMPNHYHLLVRTPRGNLSRAMRHLNGVYTQRYNRRYKTDGPVLRGRYKSILIHDDSYLKEVVRYIHQNPWKGGLEKKIGTHVWTSHKAYMDSRQAPQWLQREVVLGYFGEREGVAKTGLDAFVKEEVAQGYAKRLLAGNWPAVMGSESFKEWIREKFLGKQLDVKNVSGLRQELRETGIDKLKKIAKERWNFRDEDFSKIRRGHENLQRRALIYASRRYLKASNREIGKAYGGVLHSAISIQCRRAEEEVEGKRGCWRWVREIEDSLNSQTKT